VDCDGMVSRDELVDGLRSLGLPIDQERASRLMRHVSQLRGGGDLMAGIHVEEFDVMLTRLRLAELFLPAAEAKSPDRCECDMTICDYDAKTQRDLKLKLGPGDHEDHNVRRYFFERREPLRPAAMIRWNDSSSPCFRPKLPPELDDLSPGHFAVRWVHVDASEGLDPLTLKRLAAKYRLHPLAVDDVIDNRTPTKIDRFTSHYFVSADILTLAEQEDPARQRVRVLRSNVSIFLSVPPTCNTLLSILQNRPDASSWLATWCSADDDEHSEAASPDTRLWSTLVEDLKHTPVRRMREHRADFLLYEVLDRIVDQLRPISEAYSRRLGYMHHHAMRSFPQEWLDELDEVKLELVDLARSIRPMRQVLRHFISDTRIGGTAKMYLEDVEDAIDQTLGDISQLQEMCRTLIEAHEGYLDKRMNATLFVLSVFSAIFLPAQFITGVFGMNFVQADGTPSMPELEWEHGYIYFWLLQGGCLLTGLASAVCIHTAGERCRKCCCSRCRTPKARGRHGGPLPRKK